MSESVDQQEPPKFYAESKEMPKYFKNQFTVDFQPLEPKRLPKGKKVFPSHKYGHSYESPTYFMNQHSIICKESYNNPFLPKENDKKTKMKPTLKSNTLRNYELYKVSDQNFQNDSILSDKQSKVYNAITNTVNFVNHATDRQEDATFEQAYKSVDSAMNFKIQKQLFTQFIEMNDPLNVYGPLNMRDRPKELRIVKDYSIDPEMAKKIKQNRQIIMSPSTITQQSRFFTKPISFKFNQPNIQLSTVNSMEGSLKKVRTLPKLKIKKKIRVDEEKFFNHEQDYLNELNNSIIRESIDKKMNRYIRKSMAEAYNSSKQPLLFSDDERQHINKFEKHLDFAQKFQDQ